LFRVLYEIMAEIDIDIVELAAQGRVDDIVAIGVNNVELWDIQKALLAAAANDRLETMDLLKSWGARNYDAALNSATSAGKLDAMKHVRTWTKKLNYDCALCRAAENGQVKAMHLIRKWQPELNYDSALIEAAREGQLKAIRYLQTCGAKNFNLAFIVAASNGRVEVVKLLKQWETSRYDYATALVAAAVGGKVELLTLLIGWGAKDSEGVALENATEYGHSEAITLLQSVGERS
jgi:hypothetical protein